MADDAEVKQRGEGGDADSAASVDAARSPHSRLPFLEVSCKSSVRVLRFAFGTKAGYAVQLINLKSGAGVPPALLIEAVKEGEDSVSFGPSADLVDYGEGWKLQTVVEFGGDEVGNAQKKFNHSMPTEKSPDLNPITQSGKSLIQTGATFSFLYFGKILLVFIFMFFFAAFFTLLLENLPVLLSAINSSSI